MTERLYYTDSFCMEFEATLVAAREHEGRTALVLDRTAFYPNSGGQGADTGTLTSAAGTPIRVVDVVEDETGEILHLVELPPGADFGVVSAGFRLRGTVDSARRRDHMQQHSGQHVLSAAFIRLFDAATVSFHMGDESCTIDLDVKALSDAQLRQAEDLANAVVFEDRTVQVRFTSLEEAKGLGVRKLPADVHKRLRLIEIEDFDLTACGGTHVVRTGQIGPILLRKQEKVKQGIRVEFVCGERALNTARRDHLALVDAARLYSSHIWELPQQVRKSLDEIQAGQREKKNLLEELAELLAARLLEETPAGEKARIVSRVMAERDAQFTRLLAQKAAAARANPVPNVVLLASGGAQPTLVFAQSLKGPYDMGALMKQVVTRFGGRGGGTPDFAQGGVPEGVDPKEAIRAAREKL